jgi:hypothetical protein
MRNWRKACKVNKKRVAGLLGVCAGFLMLAPVLPWTGRYNYRPIWETIAIIASEEKQNRFLDLSLVTDKYKEQGKGDKEIKCLAARDVISSIMAASSVTTKSLGTNLGLRASSVPAFYLANAIALSIFAEIARPDLDVNIIESIAKRCQDYPGHFIHPSLIPLVQSP